jgi:uncharacterized protein (TIGR00251 family)
VSDPLEIQEHDDGVSFGVLVAPRASREAVGPVVGDRLRVAVSAPPVEGQANSAVVALLARALGVRRQDVQIVAGERGKRKTVRVAHLTRATLLAALGRAA